MRGRSRYLIALAFAALFLLVPSPDAAEGRPYLAYLTVREWLFAEDSPLAAWHAAAGAPTLDGPGAGVDGPAGSTSAGLLTIGSIALTDL